MTLRVFGLGYADEGGGWHGVSTESQSRLPSQPLDAMALRVANGASK